MDFSNSKAKQTMLVILSILVISFVVILYFFAKRLEPVSLPHPAPQDNDTAKPSAKPLTQGEIDQAAKLAAPEEGVAPLTQEEIDAAARPATPEDGIRPLTSDEIKAAAQKAN